MFRQLIQSKWFIGLIGFFIILVTVSVARLQFSISQLNRQENNLKQKLVEIENASTELDQYDKDSISRSYLEQLARIKLNYKMPDENVVFIYKNVNKQSSSSADSGDIRLKESSNFFKRFFSWLFE